MSQSPSSFALTNADDGNPARYRFWTALDYKMCKSPVNRVTGH